MEEKGKCNSTRGGVNKRGFEERREGVMDSGWRRAGEGGRMGEREKKRNPINQVNPCPPRSFVVSVLMKSEGIEPGQAGLHTV